MTISRIIARLKSNDVGFKQLILTAEERVFEENVASSDDAIGGATKKNITELIQAIQANTTIRSVFLDHFFVIILPAEDTRDLFAALGSLPKLEQMSALSRQADGWSIPMSVISKLISAAKNLSSLRLTSIGLVGNEEQFTEFTSSIGSHPRLMDFCLRGASIVNGRIPLDSLLWSLSTVPTLQKLELTAMDLHQDLGGEWPNSPTSALRFCSSSSLKSLELGGWTLDEDLVLKMAQALGVNDSLRSLVMLDSNITNRGCIALANMLKVNKSLEKLDLSYNRITDPGCTALAKMLVCNVTLKEISLFGNFQVKSRGIFLDILQNQNFVLEDLLLDSDWDADINFYLSLNRSGRYGLLRNDNQSNSEWIEALIFLQQSMDGFCSPPQDILSNLFYFVRAKPLLLCNVEDKEQFIRKMRLLRFQPSKQV